MRRTRSTINIYSLQHNLHLPPTSRPHQFPSLDDISFSVVTDTAAPVQTKHQATSCMLTSVGAKGTVTYRAEPGTSPDYIHIQWYTKGRVTGSLHGWNADHEPLVDVYMDMYRYLYTSVYCVIALFSLVLQCTKASELDTSFLENQSRE